MTGLSLGLDLGTSGIRSAVIDADGDVVSMARASYGEAADAHRDASAWWDGARRCLRNQIAALKDLALDPRDIFRIGVDGTSGSLVLTDAHLTPLTPALMYNDGGFQAEAAQIAAHAPMPHITRGPNSATARALHLLGQAQGRAVHLLHQADLVAANLMTSGAFSDENNALKTGFDRAAGGWPDWFEQIGLADIVPECLSPGQKAGQIDQAVSAELGLSPQTAIHVGTTDSIAAFLAVAPLKIGAAVTSLGTTLAIKILSDHRIDAPDVGLYSHPLGNGWLVGGASNTGGGVLRSLFTDAELNDLSQRIDPTRPSALDYYPLLSPGERFPINDPDLAPRMTPRPADDAAFLHGVFESIARIEAQCYAEIAQRGGPQPLPHFTAGGGAANPVWTAIRGRVLGHDLHPAKHTEAAIGTARLILRNS